MEQETESKTDTTVDSTVERIRALMTRRGWGQGQVGTYLGVPQNTISNWLTGTRKPGKPVARLLDVLGTIEALAPALHESLAPARRG